MTQRAWPNLSDVALQPDETKLYVTSGADVAALSNASLAPVASGSLPSLSVWTGFDSQTPAGASALAFSADGRALASMFGYLVEGQRQRRGPVWITGTPGGRALPALTDSPRQGDPGLSDWTTEKSPADGVSLTRSANGHIVLAVDPSGARKSYSASLRSWSALSPLPAGLGIAAVSDDGSWMVRSDGALLSGDIGWGSLASVLPLTHVAGGFGLTGNGRYGLVYAYRIATENGAPRARDPMLWVVDLQGVPGTPLSADLVIARIALDDAVGCTTTLAADESCGHVAAVSTAPGGASAFVLGPRGIAAVALPAGIATGQATMKRAAAIGPRQSRVESISMPMKGSLRRDATRSEAR
jgi:hypothetical protein